jgi:para-nitrobenzyl esterase
VVVTLNYRLGIAGFFAYPELIRESAHHASGNDGLLDQLTALQWVHLNICAFGGDPKKITICRQSGGAFSVNAQVTSPLSKGLFRGQSARVEVSEPGFGQTSSPSLEDSGQSGVQAAEAVKGGLDLLFENGAKIQRLLPFVATRRWSIIAN